MNVDGYVSQHNLSNSFQILDTFERKLAWFFGSKYAVLTDCCTHALELCLRIHPNIVTVPKHTYMSVPMTAMKLGLPLYFRDDDWEEYYSITNNIYDAAVLWRRNSYLPGTMMCVSFQHKKHINIGKGGCILLNSEEDCNRLRKMRYDGRDLTKLHNDDNVEDVGYHYYMTPESALRGIEIFDSKYSTPSKDWSYKDYNDLTKLKVFDHVKCK